MDKDRLDELITILAPHCLQRRSELEWLSKQLVDRKPKLVLEIGTYFGGTAAFYAAHGARVVTMDSYNNVPKAWELPPFVEKFPEAPEKIEFIFGDSHSEATLEKTDKILLEENLADIVVIDGDHTWRGGLMDWLFYAPLATNCILVHDIEEWWREPLRDNDWFPMRLWRGVIQADWDRQGFVDNEKGNWGLIEVGKDLGEFSDKIYQVENW